MAEPEGLKEVLLRLKPSLHRKLRLMTLRRSVELGRRVSMGYVVEELVNQAEQLDDPEQRAAALFAAHD